MKTVLSVLLACLMVFSLTACGVPEVDLQTVKADMLTQLSLHNTSDLLTDQLTALYGIPSDKVLDNASFMILSDVTPTEVLMIKAVDNAAAEDIAALIPTRLDALKALSPDNAALQACTVNVDHMYVSVFFSEHSADMTEIYNSYF